MNMLSQEVKPENKNLGTVLVIISAACFGMMAIFIKYAYQAELSTLTILSLRFSIAALVMWGIVFLKKENPFVERTQFLALLGLGAMGYGLMSTFFTISVRLVSASMASIILYTYPVIVTLLSSFIYREKITKYKVISLIISSTGLVMVVGIAFNGLNYLGVFYGFMAAVVYSLYIVISNKFLSEVNPIIITTYISTSAAIMFNVAGWSQGAINMIIGPTGWLSVLAIAIISSVAAILAFFHGMKIVGPSRASIISSMEPVVTIVVAFLLFGENMSLWQLVGVVMVIGAVIIIQKDS